MKKMYIGSSPRLDIDRVNRKNLILKLWIIGLSLIIVFGIFYNYNYLAFKFLIAGNYIYPETLESIYLEQLGEEHLEDDFLKNFDNVVIGVVTQKIRDTNQDRYTYLYTPEVLKAENTATQIIAEKETEIKKLSDATVYLRLPNVSKFSLNYVMKNKENLKGYDNIIIDLQSNYGGDVSVLYELADMFLPKGDIIAAEITRWSLFTKTIKDGKKQELEYKNIAILINSGTASAAEGFTNALRENLDNVTVVGEKSFGKGIGQITWPLLNGFAVKATVLKVETPNGNSIHKIGIIPDVEYADSSAIVEYTQGMLEKPE